MTKQISVIIPCLGAEEIFVHFLLFWELDCMLFYYMTVYWLVSNIGHPLLHTSFLIVSVNGNFIEQIMRRKAQKGFWKAIFLLSSLNCELGCCLGKQHLPELKWNQCREGQHLLRKMREKGLLKTSLSHQFKWPWKYPSLYSTFEEKMNNISI